MRKEEHRNPATWRLARLVFRDGRRGRQLRLYAVLEAVADGCSWCARALEHAACVLRRCPDCGRSRCFGEACT